MIIAIGANKDTLYRVCGAYLIVMDWKKGLKGKELEMNGFD